VSARADGLDMVFDNEMGLSVLCKGFIPEVGSANIERLGVGEKGKEGVTEGLFEIVRGVMGDLKAEKGMTLAMVSIESRASRGCSDNGKP
jgi:hypothetical protein